MAILLGAFWLRVYRLTGQSFWSDEGATAFMTRRGAADILAASASDIHPPLYYLLMAGWAKPAGTSEFALRFPAVVAGVLVVALTIWLGRRCLGPLPAAVGGALAAISPLLIYYSQEARMYQQLALLGLLAVALAVVLAGVGSKRPAPICLLAAGKWSPRLLPVWLAGAYVITVAALLYTQYVGFLAVLVATAIVPVRFFREGQRWRIWVIWSGLHLLAGLIFLPWAVRVFGQVGGWPAISEPLELDFYLRDVFRVFSFGLSWDATVTRTSELFVAG
ncbi:MAG TPA: glycosyltransferase family 39 protein, partial [Chloroflexota bacterium]|nr:glycosyltransferase family 39 protein [Chloroflexota bacterium]